MCQNPPRIFLISLINKNQENFCVASWYSLIKIDGRNATIPVPPQIVWSWRLCVIKIYLNIFFYRKHILKYFGPPANFLARPMARLFSPVIILDKFKKVDIRVHYDNLFYISNILQWNHWYLVWKEKTINKIQYRCLYSPCCFNIFVNTLLQHRNC